MRTTAMKFREHLRDWEIIAEIYDRIVEKVQRIEAGEEMSEVPGHSYEEGIKDVLGFLCQDHHDNPLEDLGLK